MSAECMFCKEKLSSTAAKCWRCGTIVGEMKPDNPQQLAKAESAQRAHLAQQAIEEEVLAIKQRVSRIFISSGPINAPFQVIDVVFAIDTHDEGFLSNLIQQATGLRVAVANPSIAFDKVKLQLRAQCHEMGGDAVINCQFEHRVAVTNIIPGLAAGAKLIPGVGNKQVVEIFAYGTVVKLV